MTQLEAVRKEADEAQSVLYSKTIKIKCNLNFQNLEKIPNKFWKSTFRSS